MSIDKYTEERAALLHPKLRAEVILTANELAAKGLLFRIVQGFRSFAEQDAIYAKGRTVQNPEGVSSSRPMGFTISNARGGQSYHCFGLALDFAIDIMQDGIVKSVSFDENIDTDHDGNKDWMEVVNAFGMKGWHSGLYWKTKDDDHLEKAFGMTFQQLGDLIAKGKVDAQGYVLF